MPNFGVRDVTNNYKIGLFEVALGFGSGVANIQLLNKAKAS